MGRGTYEAFHLLQENKITTRAESTHRWLQQGITKGIPPTLRKEG